MMLVELISRIKLDMGRRAFGTTLSSLEAA
jgi:hypothetical protein